MSWINSHTMVVEKSISSEILTYSIVWPFIVFVPLILNFKKIYVDIFPTEWYDESPRDFWYLNNGIWPSPLGLSLGLLAVAVGQVFTLMYFITRKYLNSSHLIPVQKVGAPVYDIIEGLMTHLGQPEGFIMLGSYLSGTWMFGLMPASYYSFSGGINWTHVLLQLLIQDFVQYCMHILEHKLDPRIYKISHKPHHKFTNPRLFDAFNGSITDTLLMILIPLVVTARIVPANVWSYMAFGSLYANWLTLIHSEYSHPWDSLFRLIGFGTAADHHVHHKLFVYNFGHLFMYWDKIFGTYKSPKDVSLFNKEI